MSFKKPISEESKKLEIPPSSNSTNTDAVQKRSTRSFVGVSTELSSCPDEGHQTKQARPCAGVDVHDVSESDTVNNRDSELRCCPILSTLSTVEVNTSHKEVVEECTSTIVAPSVSTGVILRPVTEGEKPVVRQPKANSIVVSPKQRGNPILKFIRNVPWEFGDIVPDYQFSPTSCCLFLSIRYHNVKPNYVHERLRQLANSFILRVLLVHVDVKDCDFALKELAKICILADFTMVLAFTPEEAGRYIETYKSFESKPAEMLMEKIENNYMAKVTDTLTSVKKLNKTDAATLISAFGSFRKIVEATEQDLSFCPGMGPQKASRIRKVFHQPFLKEQKRSAAQGMALKAAEDKSS